MVKQRVMKASEFKAKCLQVMDEVAETGEPVVITKNGKPVSRLVAIDERPKTLFGALKGTGKILGDIISPIDVVWEAEGVTSRHARSGVVDVREPGARRRGKRRNRKRAT